MVARRAVDFYGLRRRGLDCGPCDLFFFLMPAPKATSDPGSRTLLIVIVSALLSGSLVGCTFLSFMSTCVGIPAVHDFFFINQRLKSNE